MNPDRELIRQIVPDPPRRNSPPDLSTVPADALLDVVLDGDEPRWRRKPCALALKGRLPTARAADLLDLVRGPVSDWLMHDALLTPLSTTPGPHTAELLTVLRSEALAGLEPEHVNAVLRARAFLGDMSACRALAAMAADPWGHRNRFAEGSIDILIDVQGLDALVRELDAASPVALALDAADPAHRLLGVRLAFRGDGDITAALADPSTMVARTAYQLLSHSAEADTTLRAMVDERRPGHLWALAVLHRRGDDIRDRWIALGPPVIDLPGVPEDVREAIVRQYVPGMRDTDPRWLLEAACLPPPTGPTEAELLQRAADALADAGLRPQPPVSAGVSHQQGEGTYHEIATTAGTVLVSTLGPYFWFWQGEPQLATVMTAAGFRHIDAELGGVVIERLHVYFFGRRDPLPVRDLLFYWQD